MTSSEKPVLTPQGEQPTPSFVLPCPSAHTHHHSQTLVCFLVYILPTKLCPLVSIPSSHQHLSNDPSAHDSIYILYKGPAEPCGWGGGDDVPCLALLTDRSRQKPSKAISPGTLGQSDLFRGSGILVMPVWVRYLGVVGAKGPSPKHWPPGGRVQMYCIERSLLTSVPLSARGWPGSRLGTQACQH